jgi:histidinol-phosphate phosphatase family protein
VVLRRAVFLDRDGTLNVEAGHINAPGNLQLYPGAAAAAGALRRAGYSLYIVTNQSQVGRGFATLEQIHAVNARLEELLRGEDPDATIDAIFLCPHAPDAACGCRKPAKGMVEELLRKNEIELGESWIVGDKGYRVRRCYWNSCWPANLASDRPRSGTAQAAQWSECHSA